MNSKTPPDKELIAIVQRFEEMKEQGKILYLDAEQYEEIIEFYINIRQLKEAEEAIEMALKIHPDEPRITATLVVLYIDQDKLKEARDTLEKVLGNDAFTLCLVHAELLAAEGKMKAAEKVFNSFQNREDLDEIDYVDIGLLCNDLSFYEIAKYWFDKCLKHNPENEDALLGLCENYQFTGNYNPTIPLYNKLIDKDPYSATYWSGLAKSYFYMGEYDKAVEASDFAIVSDNKEGDAYSIKAHAYYQLENFREAIAAYKEAWRLKSLENEFAPMFIAFSYIALEEWDKAYNYIQKAISYANENSPIFQDLLINSARCLFKMGRGQDAHNTLDLVQEEYPDNIHSYILNGQYYLREEEYEKAITLFDEAVQISPTADTWYQIGINALECDQLELAKAAFETVVELDPDYEGLEEHMKVIFRKLVNCDHQTNRKIFKEHLRELIKITGERPKPFDINDFVQKAKEQGKSPEEIDDIIAALKELNDVLENFDIDQEGDEREL